LVSKNKGRFDPEDTPLDIPLNNPKNILWTPISVLNQIFILAKMSVLGLLPNHRSQTPYFTLRHSSSYPIVHKEHSSLSFNSN